MGKLVLKDEPLTHNGRLAPCGKWVEADDCFMHRRASTHTHKRTQTHTNTHGILIAQWKLLPSDQTIIHVSARRRGPCRLVLRESARVIKTSLRLEELGLIRRSLARGAPSHNFPRQRQTRTHTTEQKKRKKRRHIHQREPPKSLALRGWGDVSIAAVSAGIN